MRKSWKTSKLNIVLCLIACALLIITLSMGTTFAWFMDRIGLGTDPFQFAEIIVEEDRVTQVYNFEDGKSTNDFLAAHMVFDVNFYGLSFPIDPIVQNSLNDKFIEFWNNWNVEDRLELYSDGLKKGAIVRKEYTFTNLSEIPVYLRVHAPKVKMENINVAAYFINWQGQDASWYVCDISNYDYWLNPLQPYGDPVDKDKITFEVIAYFPILGNIGVGEPFVDAEVFVQHAEVIQATNNAVFFVDGWREVAWQELFVSYLDY